MTEMQREVISVARLFREVMPFEIWKISLENQFPKAVGGTSVTARGLGDLLQGLWGVHGDLQPRMRENDLRRTAVLFSRQCCHLVRNQV